MSSVNSQSATLRVLMMPDYRIDNPYQTLLSKSLENQGAEVLFPFGYRRVFPIFRAIKSLKKIDILHLHWISPYFKGKNIVIKLIYAIKFLIDIFLTKLVGVKIVWTIHNHISHDSQFPILEHWLQQNLFNLANSIIVHNSLVIKDIAKSYKFAKSKAEIIPHGHYREIYKNAVSQVEARQALGIPLSGIVYLNLGMLRPYKGLERLLKVWEENQEFHKESTLLIAGKALDESYLQKLTQLASTTQGVILHADFVEDSKIHLFFSAADIVVLPFEKILTSGSLILAMSYNKPIIAPRTDSIVETLGAADWLLYENQDNQGLVKALKASTQVDLNKLSELVEHECDKLSWNNIGIKTYQVYEKLLKNSII
ncbi:glycosyltransferase [Anabaena sp. UHCC 0187]|uniref:glycosyltransferase n=1 Tax=Anabaena sp. UHCC 0187 TaxID=2590018 RepID=UPI001445ACCD|nr:glycosyltransferase [Anabaena sp. UHCC 0187]MTJ11414.1 glycosyltransferase [Anabaena sp. UHCC 0187]